ncbi:type II secretion system F family protein [Cryptosporangium minutisporangium]|uniref:Type II secretion system protein GspF domain-containing protein n=1 Tax=Cryptosporangium minutisporangium TaxID=113569 RepID=A0ABP6T6A1_9ACTN
MNLTVDASTALAGLLGAGFGLGLVLIVLGLTSTATAEPSTRASRRPQTSTGRGSVMRTHGRRIALAVVGGFAAVLITRWPVAGLLAAAAIWFTPAVLGPDRATTRSVARAEAIATWAEMLRDTLQAAAGLEQALLATAPAVPAPIRTEVTALAARIRAGQHLPAVLRAAADDFADPTADLVLAALLLAAEHQARQLGPLLSDLADAARQQASVQLRQAAERARTRTSVRVITATTLAMATGLVVLNRTYLQPYDTALGQLVLAAVGALFAAGFWWLTRLARPQAPARHLALGAELSGEAHLPSARAAVPGGGRMR